MGRALRATPTPKAGPESRESTLVIQPGSRGVARRASPEEGAQAQQRQRAPDDDLEHPDGDLVLPGSVVRQEPGGDRGDRDEGGSAEHPPDEVGEGGLVALVGDQDHAASP